LFYQFPDGIEKDNPPIGGKNSKTSHHVYPVYPVDKSQITALYQLLRRFPHETRAGG